MTGKPQNNTNPRKFKEKIELLRQKEAQLTANFMEVMREIPIFTRVCALHFEYFVFRTWHRIQIYPIRTSLNLAIHFQTQDCCSILLNPLKGIIQVIIVTLPIQTLAQ